MDSSTWDAGISFSEALLLAEPLAERVVVVVARLGVQAWGSLGLPSEVPSWSPGLSLACLSVLGSQSVVRGSTV